LSRLTIFSKNLLKEARRIHRQVKDLKLDVADAEDAAVLRVFVYADLGEWEYLRRPRSKKRAAATEKFLADAESDDCRVNRKLRRQNTTMKNFKRAVNCTEQR